MLKKLCLAAAAFVLLPAAFAAAYDDESAGNDYWRATPPRRVAPAASADDEPAETWRPRQTGRPPRSTAAAPKRPAASRPGAQQAEAGPRTQMAARQASMQIDAPPPPPAGMQQTPTPATEEWENNGPPGPSPGNVGQSPPSDGSDYWSQGYQGNGHGYDDGPYDDGEMGGCSCGNGGCQGGCGGFGGNCGGCCGLGGRVYANAEYLSWWVKGDSVPTLVTTSPTDTARSAAGVLGQPGTSVLYGNDAVNNQQRSGARVTLGMWLTPGTRIEGEWFGLGSQTSSFNGSSDGGTILARPFFNLSPSVTAQDSHVISYPGQLQGSVGVKDTSRFMGAGLMASKTISFSNFGPVQRRVDFLYGFRYLRLYDSLSINDSTNSIDPNGILPMGSVFTASDSFTTTNQFYGLNLGAMSENRINRWRFTSIGRLAIGGTQQRVTINGSSTAAVPGGSSASFPGGLLAQPTNIGTYSHDAFTLVPQLELKLQYDLTQNLTFNVGYDVIYWSNVVRPGGQINTNVNTTQSSGGTLTGVPGPTYTMKSTDLWVQGVSVGGQYRF